MILMSCVRRSPVYPVTHTLRSFIAGSPSTLGGGRYSALSSTGTSAPCFRHASIQSHETTRFLSFVARAYSSSDLPSVVSSKTTCVTRRASYDDVATPPWRATFFATSTTCVREPSSPTR